MGIGDNPSPDCAYILKGVANGDGLYTVKVGAMGNSGGRCIGVATPGKGYVILFSTEGWKRGHMLVYNIMIRVV